jgi:hypothetical protein
MRFSTDLFDPGYANFRAWGTRARIFFEGIERNHIITADEEQRYVIVHKLDSNGDVVRSEDGMSTLRETLRGDVCIKLPQGEKPHGAIDWSDYVC